METCVRSLLAVAAAFAIGGCAGPRAPGTQVMGAGPSCDLRIDVGSDHRCAVEHVTPPDIAAPYPPTMQVPAVEPRTNTTPPTEFRVAPGR